MTNYTDHIDYDLLARHFAGETNLSEENTIKNLRKKDQFLHQYNILRKIWQQTGNLERFNHFDPVSAKIKIKNRINPERKLAVLSKNKSRKTYMQIAAAIVIFALFSFIAFTLFINKSGQIITQTGENEKNKIELPDGTIAFLNENSILKYPEIFKGNTRNVEIEGEAFFNVSENKNKPFIIHAFETEITVLGTSFNVDASANEVEIIVETGKVRFLEKNDPNISQTLIVGDKGSYIKNQHAITKEKNTDPNYLSWKTDKLVFEEMHLSDVFNTLNDLYEIEYKFVNDALKKCRLTASFNNQPISSIIEIIRQSHDLEIENNNNVYYISGEDCY